MPSGLEMFKISSGELNQHHPGPLFLTDGVGPRYVKAALVVKARFQVWVQPAATWLPLLMLHVLVSLHPNTHTHTHRAVPQG